jgi:N-ethylmaleimide reductase
MTPMNSLLRPVKVGALELPNRIVMAPMTRRRAGPGHLASPLAPTYYAQRATAGLIVSEAAMVAPGGASYPGSPGICDEAQASAWRGVAGAVHALGGRIFLQLWHAGRFSDREFLAGAMPVAPSAIALRGELRLPSGTRPFTTPRALATEEIPVLVRVFADAAVRAMAAGFDGVELHAAQGYLIDQFLRDGTNQRDDAYGGSVERRARFLLEVTQAVCGVVGASHVGVQLSPTSTLGDMSDSNPEATFGHAAQRLGALGVAYLHVFEPLAPGARLTPLLRAKFKGPLIANGGYDGTTAAAAIERNEADLVSFGRAFIANPDLVKRIAGGGPVATPDPSTFYGGDARGYTDYPEWTP